MWCGSRERPVAEVQEPPPLWVYLPYADERAAGMQRYGSEMVKALQQAGVRFELILGEVHGSPEWLRGSRYRVAIKGRLARRLPRPLAALARLVWLQTIFSFGIARRGGTLLALAHELPPFPRVRQIAVAHDLTDFKWFAERGSVSTRLRNALWRAGLKRSDRVVAISEATRRDLVQIMGVLPDRIDVVYEGADTSLFRPLPAPRADAGPRFLLYAGTLDPHKNLPFLFEVFTTLRGSVEDITLKLVGRHDPARAQALLASLPEDLRPAVDFVGFVSDKELAELMAQCSAFVFPSLNEGFGLAAVEAMACGAPVIAADAGSLPEVVGSGGTLLPPDDQEAWLTELVRVLTDDGYRQKMSQLALSRSRAFSWAQAAEAYRDLLLRSPAREERD